MKRPDYYSFALLNSRIKFTLGFIWIKIPFPFKVRQNLSIWNGSCKWLTYLLILFPIFVGFKLAYPLLEHRTNSNMFIYWWSNSNTLFWAKNDRTSNFERNRAFTRITLWPKSQFPFSNGCISESKLFLPHVGKAKMFLRGGS